jgi:hypothetical protein
MASSSKGESKSFSGNVARRAIQPGGEDGVGIQRPGFVRQDDEDGLGDILRQMRVSHLPQCGGMNERKMSQDQRRKRRFGLAGSILLHQGHVIIPHFLRIMTADRQKRTIYFSKTSQSQCGAWPAAVLDICIFSFHLNIEQMGGVAPLAHFRVLGRVSPAPSCFVSFVRFCSNSSDFPPAPEHVLPAIVSVFSVFLGH